MRATHGTAARASEYIAQADAVERAVAAGEHAVLRHALVVETVGHEAEHHVGLANQLSVEAAGPRRSRNISASRQRGDGWKGFLRPRWSRYWCWRVARTAILFGLRHTMDMAQCSSKR